MRSNTIIKLVYKTLLYLKILENIVFKEIEKIIEAKKVKKKKQKGKEKISITSIIDAIASNLVLKSLFF